LGTLYVNVFVPKEGSAGTLAQQIAVLVADALRSYDGADIEFSRIRVNEAGVDGSFYGVNVLADFEYLQLN
jgi:hypothetical protein